MIDEIALWWENMAGPRMLIEEMSKSLSDGKNVVLRLDGDLPWHSSMRDIWRISSAPFRSSPPFCKREKSARSFHSYCGS